MNRCEQLGLLLCAGLSLLPRAAAAFPWSHDMFRGAAVQPLAVPPRNLPSGTLPTHGGAPPMSREVADGTLHNPLAASPEHLTHGQFLFETNCMPCHGSGATGDGPVAFLMILPPPNLTVAQPAERTDGYLYATIRNGGVVMPSYADAMSAEERWEVVLYLRQLQGRLQGP
jgi:mono/diheme cytochrome c family protein